MTDLHDALREHDDAHAPLTDAWRAVNAAYGTPDQANAEQAWQAAQTRARHATDTLLNAIRSEAVRHPTLRGPLNAYLERTSEHEQAARIQSHTDNPEADETARKRWLDTFSAQRQARQDLITAARALQETA